MGRQGLVVILGMMSASLCERQPRLGSHNRKSPWWLKFLLNDRRGPRAGTRKHILAAEHVAASLLIQNDVAAFNATQDAFDFCLCLAVSPKKTPERTASTFHIVFLPRFGFQLSPFHCFAGTQSSVPLHGKLSWVGCLPIRKLPVLGLEWRPLSLPHSCTRSGPACTAKCLLLVLGCRCVQIGEEPSR